MAPDLVAQALPVLWLLLYGLSYSSRTTPGGLILTALNVVISVGRAMALAYVVRVLVCMLVESLILVGTPSPVVPFLHRS